ncbi:unnamed protein product [Sphagnum balticum]
MANCEAVDDQVYKCCKVGIIGAGAAGLVTAKELLREGHKVVVFEQAMHVGGLWVYDPEADSDLLGIEPHRKRVHSSAYASLRTNIPRLVMSFIDFPFLAQKGRDARFYPGHNEVALYLEDFAKEFDLLRVIQFGIDTWPGPQMHSHNYRVAEPFTNQTVVIIGAQPSGADISRDVAAVAKEVHLSARSWRPSVDLAKPMGQLQNIWPHSAAIRAREDGTVEFEDGSSTMADAIIHCTGFVG